MLSLLLVNLVLGFLIWLCSPLDMLTAMLCAVPGGMSDTPIIAADLGADFSQLPAPVKGEHRTVVFSGHIMGNAFRIFRPLPGKKREHHLLRRVVIPLRRPGKITGLKIEPHAGFLAIPSLR